MSEDFMKFVAKAATAERQAAVVADYVGTIEDMGFLDEHLSEILKRTTPRRREKLMGAWREFRDWAKARDLPAVPPVSAPIAAFWIYVEFARDLDPKKAELRGAAIKLMNDEVYLDAAVAFCRSFSDDGGGGGKVIPLTRKPVAPPEQKLAAHAVTPCG